MPNILNKQKLTKPQLRCFRWLEKNSTEKVVFASVDDVRIALNFPGKSSAWRVLDYLKRKEWIAVESMGPKQKSKITLLKSMNRRSPEIAPRPE